LLSHLLSQALCRDVAAYMYMCVLIELSNSHTGKQLNRARPNTLTEQQSIEQSINILQQQKTHDHCDQSKLKEKLYFPTFKHANKSSRAILMAAKSLHLPQHFQKGIETTIIQNNAVKSACASVLC